MQYMVLGAGRQGIATAYDLAKHGKAKRIVLVDQNGKNANEGCLRLRKLCNNVEFIKIVGEVGKIEYYLDEWRSNCCVCALPYEFGADAAKASVKKHTPFCDLGCDTEIVRKQLELNSEAKKAGVAIVPDCGLAPGNSTMFAMFVFRELVKLKTKPFSITTYCGGLPGPVDWSRMPLKYKIVYSPFGLINNYVADAWVLEDGKVFQVPSLDAIELEELDFQGIKLEAFDTAGGASLLPWKFKKLGLHEFRYKTLRYPGHCKEMNFLKKLGLLDIFGKERDALRRVWEKVISKKIEHPDVADIVYLRAVGSGFGKKGEVKIQLDMIDHHDCDTGFSAMERTTGFAAGMVASMLAHNKIKPGVHTPDDSIDPLVYICGLKKRGFEIVQTLAQRVIS